MNPEQIQRIRIPLGERFADLWLFVGSERAVLFDSGVRGTLESAVVPHLAERQIPAEKVDYVVISHLDVDHSGDVGAVHTVLPRAKVMAHRGDVEAIENWEAFSAQRGREFAEGWGLDESPDAMAWMKDVFFPGPVDVVLDGDTVIDLGDREIAIWHIPGHSHGHLGVYDAHNDTLAVSDAILGDAVPLADGTPSFPPTYRHVDAYLATIERARTLSPATLLTAHYGDYVGEQVPAFLNTTELFVRRMDEQVMAALQPEGQTLHDIVKKVNPAIATWPLEGTETALAFPVAGHLERARSAGLATMVDDEGIWRWSA